MRTIAFLMVLSLYGIGINAQNQELQNFTKSGEQIEAQYFHSNGNVAQIGSFNLKNQLDGLWTSYDVAGRKLSQGQYQDGKKIGLWSFFQNSKLVLVEYDESKIIQVTNLTITDNPVVTRFDDK